MNTDMIASIIESLQEEVSDNVSRYNFYVDFVNILEKYDFDCFDELHGIDPEFDTAVEEHFDNSDFDEDEVEGLDF